MKVLVTGVTGQLGYDVAKELERRHIEYKGVGSKDMDLTVPSEVEKVVVAFHPDAVIHCAAYTAVDKAEDEYGRAMDVNAKGTLALAKAAKAIDAKLLYISTDYVFDGKGSEPFAAYANKGPLNVYGLTKLLGEQAVQLELDKYFIVRISWVFGKNGNNFIKTMLRLGQSHDELTVVADQWGSPTYTADLAPLLCDMVETEKYGVYHATNEGITNWAEFAAAIMKEANLSCRIRQIPSSDYPTRAVRPLNSRMDKSALDKAGFTRLPEWRDALRRYLKEIGTLGG